MTTFSLGRLEPVDLRTVWAHEAQDFTPWLAREDNLALLADTIGLDLELITTEKPVGPYRADIVCKDTVTSQRVLIENQVETTDHTHMGQLITYAAGLDAVTIVWIARRFTEEHRAALDWLNESTNENVDFFGLEIELWRIGDSAIAPKFNIISQPNDWIKRVASERAAVVDGLTPTKELQLEYWQEFQKLVAEQSTLIKARKALPQNWSDFAIGRYGFYLQAAMDSRKQQVNVGLVLVGDDKAAHYHLLKAQQASIEQELGQPLTWWELPNKKSSFVSLYRHDAPLDDRDDWPAQHQWMLSSLEQLHKVFAGRVKQLDASDYKAIQRDNGDALTP